MPDLGATFNRLSPTQQASLMKAVDALARLHPDVASDVSVSSEFGSVTLNVKAPPGRDIAIQNDMMGPITDIMLDSGVLIVMLVTRRDP